MTRFANVPEVSPIDVHDALRLYSAIADVEIDGGERCVVAIVPGPPVSKSRARFGKRQVYSRPEMIAAERRTGTFLRAALGPEPFAGNVALGCIFYRPNFQRIDVDNLLKHVCDSANGVAWADDCQVTAIYGRIELDVDRPRTVVVMGAHRSSLLRGLNDHEPCGTCGKPVQVAGSRRARVGKRYCSRECSAAARVVNLSEPVPCAQCGQPFRRTTTAQRMCSAECRVESRRVARLPAAPKSACRECGKELGHRRGGRCRECWQKDPRGATS